MCKNAIGSTQAVNRGALLLYKARKGRKDRRKERLSLSLSLSLRLSGVGTVGGNAEPARRDLSWLASVACCVPSRSQPVQVCAPASGLALPLLCLALPSAHLLCSWRRANRSTSSHFPRSPSSFLSASHTHTVFLPGSVSRPLLASHAENERNAKIRAGTTPTPPPCLLLVKPLYRGVRPRHMPSTSPVKQTPPHTLLPLRATNGSRHVLPHPPDPPSHVRLQPRATLRPSTPNTTSEHVSTRRRPPLGATDLWGRPAGTPETERLREGGKKRKVSRTVQYATQEGDLSLSFLPVVKAEPWGQPASPSPTRSGGARPRFRSRRKPGSFPFSARSSVRPSVCPLL